MDGENADDDDIIKLYFPDYNVTNTGLCRKNARDSIIINFPGCIVWHSPKDKKNSGLLGENDIDLNAYAVAIHYEQGRIAAVCTYKIWETDQVEAGEKSWGEIKLLATHPDHVRKGCAKAATRAALLFIQAHTQNPSFGLYCDLNEDGTAMKFWEGCGMSLSDNLPDKDYLNGANATWMEGDIAAVLANLDGSRREACQWRLPRLTD